MSFNKNDKDSLYHGVKRVVQILHVEGEGVVEQGDVQLCDLRLPGIVTLGVCVNCDLKGRSHNLAVNISEVTQQGHISHSLGRIKYIGSTRILIIFVAVISFSNLLIFFFKPAFIFIYFSPSILVGPKNFKQSTFYDSAIMIFGESLKKLMAFGVSIYISGLHNSEKLFIKYIRG